MASQAPADHFALPTVLFRLVWLGHMPSEADLFDVDLAARRPGHDDRLDNVGIDNATLASAETRREQLRRARPAPLFAALTGATRERATGLMGELGSVVAAIALGRRQLCDNAFRLAFLSGMDRDERWLRDKEWRAVHLKRAEAEALDHWRQPVLDAWADAGVVF